MKAGRTDSADPAAEQSDARNTVQAARLRAVRDRFRLNQTEMAREAGVAMRTWQDYEAAKMPPGARVLENLHRMGVDTGWVLTGDGEMMRHQDTSGIYLIPMYDVRPAAGRGGAISDPDEPSSHLAADRNWIRRTLGCAPESLVVVEAGGDSMYPTIANRDPLFVNTSDKDFSQNAIYAFRVAEAVQVKRIQRKMTGQIVLISDNQLYAPETLSKDEAETLEVIGRVVWYGHKL